MVFLTEYETFGYIHHKLTIHHLPFTKNSLCALVPLWLTGLSARSYGKSAK
jgi:hypothetical protein